MSKTFRILFVCSGNSCRSPMAEGMLRAKLPPELREHVEVQSAGTLGIEGAPATHFAIRVAYEHGANIVPHRSQGINAELVRNADLIFAMAPEHKSFIEQHYPEVRENVFLLRAFDRQSGEAFDEPIEDPIGGNLETYRSCGRLIDAELERILPRLTQLIKERLNPSE